MMLRLMAGFSERHLCGFPMLILPLMFLLLPMDSTAQFLYGISAGTGLPFGGNGFQLELGRKDSLIWNKSLFAAAGISIGGNENPKADFYWLGNSFGVNWDRGKKHRLRLSAAVVTATFSGSRPVNARPEKRFVAGPIGAAAYVFRAGSGFQLLAGMNLVLLQNPLEKSRAFQLSPSPFLGLGWYFTRSGKK